MKLRSRIWLFLLAAALLGLLAIRFTQASTITYYTESDTSLYDYDTEAGTSTFRAQLDGFNEGRKSLFSMDIRWPDEAVFGIVSSTGAAGGGLLRTSESDAWHLTFLGDPGPNWLYTDIAIHHGTGTLYAGLWDRTTRQRYLVEIEPLTGSFSMIGELPFVDHGSDAFAFNEDDELFALFTASTASDTLLYRIDLTDGSGTLVGSLSESIDTCEDAVFVDGRLFVTDWYSTMHEVNTLTGESHELSAIEQYAGGLFAEDFPVLAPDTDGDLDYDGDVDDGDLNSLLSSVDSPLSLQNEVDLEELLGNFGRTDMTTQLTTPEPGTAALLVLGMILLLAKCRR